MKRYLFILLILFSCKSTKRTLVENNRVESELVNLLRSEVITDLGNLTKKTTITETIIEKHEQVQGTNIIKPVATKTITTTIQESENKNQVIKKAIEEQSVEMIAFDSLFFDRETEGMEVVEEIVGGITGALFGNIFPYVISAIFIVILLMLIFRLFRKKD